MNTGATLFAPRFLRGGIEGHKSDIARRLHSDVATVDAVVAVLYRRISWVSDDDIATHVRRARAATGAIDAKDVAYLACALAVGADAIWSHGRDFDRQTLVPRVARPD